MAMLKNKKHRQQSKNSARSKVKITCLLRMACMRQPMPTMRPAEIFRASILTQKKHEEESFTFWFTLDPTTTSSEPTQNPFWRSFQSTVNRLMFPVVGSGSFHVGRRSRWGRLCNKFKQQHQLLTKGCPNELTGKLLIVRTRTVTSDLKQRTHESHENTV